MRRAEPNSSAFGFSHSIKPSVMRRKRSPTSKCRGVDGAGSKFGKDAKRHALGIDFGESVAGGGIVEERAMAGGKDFEIASGRFAGNTDEGDKAAGIEIARDGIVNGGKGAEESHVSAEIGA